MDFSFASDHLKDETEAVNALLQSVDWDAARSARVHENALRLIAALRASKAASGEIETFLKHYPLQSAEGLALMTLAEALLRIPDAATKDRLIDEKLASADWSRIEGGDRFLNFAGGGLSVARKALGSVFGGIGKPVIRKGLEEAVKRIGRQFVVGETIAEAWKTSAGSRKKGYRLSYDMLGEGARTRDDAERYFQSYLHAARDIGARASASASPQGNDGMSVKLSALHPRYQWSQEKNCVPDIAERLVEICTIAARHNIGVTIDAEEADRLELSLKILDLLLSDSRLSGWDGLGMAVQAYDKRCFRLIDDITGLCASHGRRMQIRLVKGAYWDSEIKRAQIAGLPDYPLFTRKANTDLSYIACAAKLLKYRDRIYPMFGTHNAVTVASIADLADQRAEGFEFQRLYGMGETLGDEILWEHIAPVCIYAPVGQYGDLLPYLVRRMLENGANTSFIRQLGGGGDFSTDAVAAVAARQNHRHAAIPLPRDLFPDRINSAGADLSVAKTREDLTGTKAARTGAISLIGGVAAQKRSSPSRISFPANFSEDSGEIWDATTQDIEPAFDVARKGLKIWSAIPAAQRAKILNRVAELIARDAAPLIGYLQSEAGKTLADALAELREAQDFCRYYAAQGETMFDEGGQALPGPTGESNVLTLEPRGVFVCISPWNFPLAIFTGQIVAALMAGNAVIAKPAEQTPVISLHITRLLIEAGVPELAITLLLGDGNLGSALVGHRDVSGVVFTGSLETARRINRALAAKDGDIVPLIAETGGQNAMIIDSSALLEQAVDDVVLSAFGSAGQRCSALRVLYLQEDIAERFYGLLAGAMQELKTGDPRDTANDIGPVIDAEALRMLQEHEKRLQGMARKIASAPMTGAASGFYFAPAAYEIQSLDQLTHEIFGPVLHCIRFKSRDRDTVIDAINASGYGLTFGLHSRLEKEFSTVAAKIRAGNIYINRSMTGAVVGVQPFGGTGLSGTGPKAGGPHYLSRFASEKCVTVNETATGGNLNLITLEDDNG